MTPLWLATESQLEKIGLPPPYWAFPWVGGQALARLVLDRADLVMGKRVLDFAAGSGLAAIAAAKAGAASVDACEIDAFAAAAISANAQANGVSLCVRLEDVTETDEDWDVILAGDICYERPMAAKVFAWLRTRMDKGAMVLMGDPGRAYLPSEGLEALATYDVPTTRELEDRDVRRVTVYRLTA